MQIEMVPILRQNLASILSQIEDLERHLRVLAGACHWHMDQQSDIEATKALGVAGGMLAAVRCHLGTPSELIQACANSDEVDCRSYGN
jgi:hypothetical protein